MAKMRLEFPLAIPLLLMLGTATAASETAQKEPPLRLTEPLEQVISDLESFVPSYMAQREIPGVGVALIRDGQVVWNRGFGVANRFTSEPLTDGAVFEIASNSKVITAYVALRLVDEGRLELDGPLNRYLPESYLPPSDYREAITLRHAISHSAGFGHNTLSRESLFPPGSRFSYSGIGFVCVQKAIEAVTGEQLENVARELVFEPLGMSSTSYVNEPRLTARTANGHIWAVVPAVIMVLLFLISLPPVTLLAWPILRILRGRWRPSRQALLTILGIAFSLSLGLGFFLLGEVGLTEFAWLIAFCAAASAAAFVLALKLGKWFLSRVLTDRRRLRKAALAVWAGLLLLGLGVLSVGVRTLPVPRWPSVPAGGAGSVRGTTSDLAAFLLELAAPQRLKAETAAEMRRPQVRLSKDLSWGLGPGILHTAEGDALWQWGQHIDFQSLMLIYPDLGFGVVVMTNSDLLDPDVAIRIAHRAIGGKIEPALRASHLEFN